MKEPLLVKVAALGGSLLGFHIAKQNEREVIPLMMIGGLLGGCLAEWVIPDNEGNGKNPIPQKPNPQRK